MTEETTDTNTELLSLTADIVAAYVSNNPLPVSDLRSLISDTHSAILRLRSSAGPVAHEKLVPAVPIKKSITPDFLICLENGKKFKSLKRHIGTHYNLTPDEYRTKWGLPADYPMVAPAYSAARSHLAKTMGLGRKAAVPEPVEPPMPAKRRKIGVKIT